MPRAQIRAAWAVIAACAATAVEAQQPPLPFRFERASEDWSKLKDPAERKRPWHALKAIPLGDQGLLTFGADVQLKYEVQDPPFLGVFRDVRDDYLLVRGLVHANARFNPNTRLFMEIGNHDGIGRTLPFPLNDNRFDVTQAFLELSGKAGNARLTARIGRQEMTLSPRYFASRGGVNTRQRYQGVRGWSEHGPWRLEGFWVQPMRDLPAAWDDEPDDTTQFTGLKISRAFGPRNADRATLNLYRQEKQNLAFRGRRGDEDRLWLGGRLQLARSGYDFDGEGYLQTGDYAGLDVSAWSFSFDAGKRFSDAPLSPRLGLRALGGSGDKSASDGEINTFLGNVVRPICCADPLFLLPTNLVAATPVVEVKLAPKLTLEAIAPTYWRLEEADALYAYPQIPYPRTAGMAGDDFISFAPQVTLTWSPIPEVYVQGAALTQSAEGALKASGAKDAALAYLMVQFRF